MRSERRLSANSLNVAVQAVRAFQEWVLGHAREACVRGVPKCKRDTVRAEVYAKSEIAALLRAAQPGRDRVLLALIYGCGLRREDARLLRTDDIDTQRKQLRVRHGKGAKERVLPLPDHLIESLRAYWRADRAKRPGHDSPWLFQGAHPGQPMSKSLLLHLYARAVRTAGIKRKGGLHTLRHSLATQTSNIASTSLPWQISAITTQYISSLLACRIFSDTLDPTQRGNFLSVDRYLSPDGLVQR